MKMPAGAGDGGALAGDVQGSDRATVVAEEDIPADRPRENL